MALTISTKIFVAHPHPETYGLTAEHGLGATYRMPTVTEWEQFRSAIQPLEDESGSASVEDFARLGAELCAACWVETSAVDESGEMVRPWDLGVPFVITSTHAIIEAVLGKRGAQGSGPTAE